MFASLILAAVMIPPGQTTPPQPPAPLVFSVPSGALPWPVPFATDFSTTEITIPSMVHSDSYTTISAAIQSDADALTSPIEAISGDLDGAFLDMPDPSSGLDAITMVDPVTGSTFTMQDMVDDSVTRVITPFTYSKSLLQFGDDLTTEFPALSNIWLMLVTMLVNTAVHFLMLFIRAGWGFLKWFVNLVDKAVSYFIRAAQLIRG